MISQEIIDKIRELNEIKKNIKINDNTDSLGISENAIKSLQIIDRIITLEPNKKIRELIYNYVNFLDDEFYTSAVANLYSE
jgi:hypothetical protein